MPILVLGEEFFDSEPWMLLQRCNFSVVDLNRAYHVSATHGIASRIWSKSRIVVLHNSTTK